MFSLIPDLYAMSPQKDQADPGMMNQLMLFGTIFMIFYFLVIRPQQKKAKAHGKLVDNMKVGDEVITSSGLYGKVKKKSDDQDFIELEIAQNTVIKVQKEQITSINP